MTKRVVTREEVIDADFTEGLDRALEKVASYLERFSSTGEIAQATVNLSFLGKEQSPFETFDWEPAAGESHEDVAKEVVGAAELHGKDFGRGGNVKFKVTVDGYKQVCAFALTFPELDEDEVDEAPNESGIAAQAMRHNEKMHKSLLAMTELLVGEMKDARQKDAKRIDMLERGYLLSIEQAAKLNDMRHVQEMELRRIEKEETRKDEVAGMLMTAVQLAGNRVAGGPLFNKQTTNIEQTVYALLSSIPPETFQQVIGEGKAWQMTEAQRLGLAEVFRLFMERQQAVSQGSEGQGGSQ